MDSTEFREDFLIAAVDYAHQNGWKQYHPTDPIISLGGFDRFRSRDALRYWCRFVRAGATQAVLTAFDNNPDNDSYAINDESLRMVDYIRRMRRMATNTTHINQVNGPVHTGSGDLNVDIKIEVGLALQRLDAALAAAGASPDQRKTFVQKVIQTFREVGTDVAAKIAVELTRP